MGIVDVNETVTLRFAPLDVPLEIELARTPHLPALAAACRDWEGDRQQKLKPLRVRLAVAAEFAGTGEVEIRAAGPRLLLAGSGASGWALPSEGRAECLVSHDYLANPERLQESVLEPLVLFLLTHQDRTPIHASGFAAGDMAVLLAGRSGAGKSCLARAADAAGFQVLSDDTVYVRTGSATQVWGWPRAAHLLPVDASASGSPLRLRNGRLKHVVPLRSGRSRVVRCDAAALCVLARGDAASLSRVSPSEAFEALSPLDRGFDLLADQVMRALTALTVRGAWRLTLSDDPSEAIRLLTRNLPLLRQTAVP